MANLQWCQRATMARQAVAAGGKEGAQQQMGDCGGDGSFDKKLCEV